MAETYVSILDATPSGLTANSYLTAADATLYLTRFRLFETAWLSATLPNQEAALIWATALLDRSFDFEGSVTNYNQPLRWPRVGIEDDDGRYVNQTTIPPIVKQSTAILAAELLKQDRTAVPKLLSLGIKSARIGPLSVDLDQMALLSLIPDFVILWMGQYGTLRGGATNGGMRQVTLVRT